MKIIKGICQLIIYACLIGVAATPFMYEAETLNWNEALLSLAVLTLTGTLAFIGGLVAEKYGDRKLDFAEFIHREYLKINADERQLNRR